MNMKKKRIFLIVLTIIWLSAGLFVLIYTNLYNYTIFSSIYLITLIVLCIKPKKDKKKTFRTTKKDKTQQNSTTKNTNKTSQTVSVQSKTQIYRPTYPKRNIQEQTKQRGNVVTTKDKEETKNIILPKETKIQITTRPTSAKIINQPNPIEKSEKNREELLRVNYSVPNIDNTNWEYPVVKFPKKDCVVFPARSGKTKPRGYTEEMFQNKLTEALSNNEQYKVLGNVILVAGNNTRPYEPDIAIICNSNLNIRIDIEIDEPYTGNTRKPTHFIYCGDEMRDVNLNRLGWIVIRFTEKQIFTKAKECISYICKQIYTIDKSFVIPTTFTVDVKKEKRWTELQSQCWAKEKYREKYLNHEFSKKDSEFIEEVFSQTEQEKKYAEKVEKICLPKEENENIDNSPVIFNQDKDISFEPNEHIYLYKGSMEFIPVSSTISKFFKQFDAYYWAERKTDTEEEFCAKLEEWDYAGSLARETGTFLHKQIENHFHKIPTENIFHFKYNGIRRTPKEDIDISKEISFFKNFLSTEKVNPFRTEWRIYDKNLEIAGTIDFICKNEGKYDIYDWKRSKKVSPHAKVYSYGLNGLEEVPDTSYYHYCLQQNLYKYILEKNYGISVNAMYLVVLHPENSNYIKYTVPDMQKEVEIIIRKLKSKTI